MNHLLKFAFALLPCFAFADGPGFTDLNQSEFRDVVKDFGSGWHHTSVSPASALGDLFGFEVGVIVGTSKAPAIEKMSKELDPDSDFKSLVHAGFLGAVSFPVGITAELNFLPEVNNADVEFQTGSLGVKWTFSKLLELPVDLSAKLHVASSRIKWKQQVSGTATGVAYEQQAGGLLLQVSKSFVIVEPYVSIGTLRTTGKMSVEGTGTVFSPSYTANNSAKETVTGGVFMIGANLNLMLVKLGLEVGRALENTVVSSKLSFYF